MTIYGGTRSNHTEQSKRLLLYPLHFMRITRKISKKTRRKLLELFIKTQRWALGERVKFVKVKTIKQGFVRGNDSLTRYYK